MICPHCGKDFIKGNQVHQIYCGPTCTRNAGKKRSRKKNGLSENRKARNIERKTKKVEAAKDYVYRDKISRGCSRCPERRPSALQYHHLNRATKKLDVGRMYHRCYALAAIIEEISKCIILCANCHSVEENGDGYKESDRPKQ